MQKVDEHGDSGYGLIGEAYGQDDQYVKEKFEPGRMKVRTLYNSTPKTVQQLKESWANKTPPDAKNALKERDIAVTNQSDKDEQIEKMDQLDHSIEAWTEGAMAEDEIVQTSTDFWNAWREHHIQEFPASSLSVSRQRSAPSLLFRAGTSELPGSPGSPGSPKSPGSPRSPKGRMLYKL